MKLLVASPQRSGTYLTAKVMEREHKLTLSNLHLGMVLGDEIRYHLFNGRRIDRKSLKEDIRYTPVADFGQLIPEDSVSVTHMDPEPLLHEWFDYIVYVKREIRQAMVSRFYWGMHHDIEIKPENFPKWMTSFGQDIVRHHQMHMSRWEAEADEIVHYEDLVKNPENLKLETPTNSFGKTPKWQDIWSPVLEEVYQHYWK